MIEPWFREIARQRQEERLESGRRARLARDSGDTTPRPSAARWVVGLVFARTPAHASGARPGYPAGSDARASS